VNSEVLAAQVTDSPWQAYAILGFTCAALVASSVSEILKRRRAGAGGDLAPAVTPVNGESQPGPAAGRWSAMPSPAATGAPSTILAGAYLAVVSLVWPVTSSQSFSG
jgi:hypothetical protein